jgi:hypothetical protein
MSEKDRQRVIDICRSLEENPQVKQCFSIRGNSFRVSVYGYGTTQKEKEGLFRAEHIDVEIKFSKEKNEKGLYDIESIIYYWDEAPHQDLHFNNIEDITKKYVDYITSQEFLWEDND